MLHIRTMTEADISFGMHLKAQAGWNQRATDWRRALDLQPDGCFLAEWQGQPAGTTTYCCFDAPPNEVAWIALVLVEKDLRGRGIGKALVQHALAALDRRGVPSVWLDATAFGQPLYEKLGFVPIATFLRYQRPASEQNASAVDDTVRPGDARDLPPLLEFDRAAYGYDRSRLIRRLAQENPSGLRVFGPTEDKRGFCLMRDGDHAVQIGPCVADAAAGPALLTDVLDRSKGRPHFIDVPESHTAARSFVEARGFQVQRRLVRMVRGVHIRPNYERIWASFGPEKG